MPDLKASRRRQTGVAACLIAAAGLCWGNAAWAESPLFQITGMTFVASRDGETEVVVRAEHAVFDPDTRIAHLETVRAEVTESAGAVSFDMSCERADLELDTSDFVAEGNVTGTTADGRRFSGDVVHYDHEQGLLYADTPVVIEETTGIFFRGGGFRYQVKDQHFRLLDGASVVQQP